MQNNNKKKTKLRIVCQKINKRLKGGQDNNIKNLFIIQNPQITNNRLSMKDFIFFIYLIEKQNENPMFNFWIFGIVNKKGKDVPRQS